MRMQKQKQRRDVQAGLTLAELMVASMILIITIVGLLVSFLSCLELTEITRNATIAMNTARTRMEQIKNTTFNNIVATYDEVSFTTPDLTGRGISYIDDTNPDLLRVTVSFSWRQKSKLVVGEDKDLDGVIDAGEDTNANGMLDSPVQIVNNVFRR